MSRAFLILIPVLALLSGCVSPAQQLAARQQQEAEDHQKCLQLGFKPNTEPYGNCRLQLLQIRAINRQATRVYYTPDPLFDYHHARY